MWILGLQHFFQWDLHEEEGMYAILICDHIVLCTCTNILVIFSRLYVFEAYLDRNGDITKSRNIFKK